MLENGYLLAGTSKGLFRISAGGPTQVGTSQSVSGLAAHGDTIVVALGADGILVSADGGTTWSSVQNLPLDPVSVEFDPHDPLRIYAGTKPAGILVSTDAGRTWSVLKDFRELPGTELWEIPELDPNKPVTSVASGEGAAAWVVRADPHKPGRVIVGVEVGGLVVTEDAGRTWRIVQVGDSPDPHDIVIHPADPDVVVVSTGYSRFTDKPGVFAYSPTGGVYRSQDRGESFVNVWENPEDPQYTRLMSCDTTEPFAITVCARSSYVQPNNPNGERRADLRQSRDKGLSWTSLGDGEYSRYAEEFSSVVADPDNPGSVYVGTEKGRLFHVRGPGQWQEVGRLDGRINGLVVGVPARPDPSKLANTTI